jgi:hypothetical protein
METDGDITTSQRQLKKNNTDKHEQIIRVSPAHGHSSGMSHVWNVVNLLIVHTPSCWGFSWANQKNIIHYLFPFLKPETISCLVVPHIEHHWTSFMARICWGPRIFLPMGIRPSPGPNADRLSLVIQVIAFWVRLPPKIHRHSPTPSLNPNLKRWAALAPALAPTLLRTPSSFNKNNKTAPVSSSTPWFGG